MVEGKSPGQAVFWVGLNTALVGLQRYNRARMTQRVNDELEAGHTFDPDYKNWLGIDGRAVENYEATLTSQAPEQSPATIPHVGEMPTTPIAPRPVRY